MAPMICSGIYHALLVSVCRKLTGRWSSNHRLGTAITLITDVIKVEGGGRGGAIVIKYQVTFKVWGLRSEV